MSLFSSFSCTTSRLTTPPCLNCAQLFNLGLVYILSLNDYLSNHVQLFQCWLYIITIYFCFSIILVGDWKELLAVHTVVLFLFLFLPNLLRG